ncbi:MAG: calcium-binding protein [Microcystis panniformis Mp_MB_F_20051200_S9]|uniref:Calcium-binding protein n=1 Tax=Microcystis panniformis Mp_MB_F_20051200_S9 TaxID=2486223 RepID=A0A552PQ42_9CHRO|nr:MAG: calcium-binding protein [Microcystis panniformis Mp_GB_SS_20050300_S99D]TRV45548.1 MAG: calcium-binding protein [Microcystis panniformis Mp_MB_F_20080800_S26D]TRV52967.1 MAG: calcium-binding protein [Microcystis panniformis Mp_GB_SS_20050300_S99]TRV59108.1 MAG: calcium-binding protein [Microcystis panniformis Mp_MB_F_20051200_S9]TRV60988.1 MAG: calcium-binding protein [Microcystis panniformis Mp_MB_F_20080800_S26]TRV65911.1 MAG: calcium-binding protein [Microcystis panniformis Mp_MB_F_
MVTISTSFSSLSTGVSFNPAITQSVRNFLTTFNDILIHVSGPSIPGNNLTSQGLLADGVTTVWRITTADSPPANLTLDRLGGGFSRSFSTPPLPANSFTFVKGGAAGNYVLSGDNFRKQLASGPQQNQIWLLTSLNSYNIVGSASNDTLSGFNAGDTIFGGDGNDSLLGQAGADTLHGDNGGDTLLGGSGNDSLDGDVGDDSLDGGSLDDTLIGGSGSDTLLGNSNNDTLDGGTEDDSLDGGTENDSLLGGTGTDTLDGGTEDDTLIGGDGNDTLTGGGGIDRFVYNNSSEGVDSITDFGDGVTQDVIVLSSPGFGGLTTIGGTLDTSLFATGENGTAKIIYSGGVLSFDQDLGLPGTLVTIANIAGLGAASLNASNIQVIA